MSTHLGKEAEGLNRTFPPQIDDTYLSQIDDTYRIH